VTNAALHAIRSFTNRVSVVIRKIISLSFLAFVLIAIGYAFRKDPERFRLLLHVHWSDIALLAGSSLGFYATLSAIFGAACKPFGVRLSYLEVFGLTILSSCMSFTIPVSGVGFRGAYLLRRHKLRFSDYSGLMIAIIVIEFAVYGAAALVASFWLSLAEIYLSPPVIAICAGAVVAAAGAVFIPVEWARHCPAVIAVPAVQITRFQKLLRETAVSAPLLVWTTLNFICFALVFAIAYRSIGAPVPFGGAIIAAALSDFSFFVRIAPGSLGSLEAAVYYASSLFSLTLSDSLIIAMLVRLGLAMVFLPLSPLCFWLLFKVRKRAD
jgi:uncharacterized membrane protein YbhN (UPF0104 family)